MSEETIESVLKGNTLRVYWFLLRSTNGEYRLVKAVNVGVLKQFVRFGSLMLPRHFLYATMFTTLLILYLTQFNRVDFFSLFVQVLGALATAIMWYETLKAWRPKP